LSRPPPSLPFSARLAARSLRALLRGLCATCRVASFEGQGRLERLRRADEPVILCFWHNRLAVFAWLLEQRWLRRGTPLAMMASLSRDGQFGAAMGELAGARVVRGSANQGGTQGLRALYRLVAKERLSIVIAPDGSQGPVYQAKAGVASLAQMTGASIVPLACSVDRHWRVNSWDRLYIPKPFARLSVSVGRPVRVPRGGGDAALKAALEETQRQLETLQPLEPPP